MLLTTFTFWTILFLSALLAALLLRTLFTSRRSLHRRQIIDILLIGATIVLCWLLLTSETALCEELSYWEQSPMEPTVIVSERRIRDEIRLEWNISPRVFSGQSWQSHER